MFILFCCMILYWYVAFCFVKDDGIRIVMTIIGFLFPGGILTLVIFAVGFFLHRIGLDRIYNFITLLVSKNKQNKHTTE